MAGREADFTWRGNSVCCCLPKIRGSLSNPTTERMDHGFAPWLPGQNECRAGAEVAQGACGHRISANDPADNTKSLTVVFAAEKKDFAVVACSEAGHSTAGSHGGEGISDFILERKEEV